MNYSTATQWLWAFATSYKKFAFSSLALAGLISAGCSSLAERADTYANLQGWSGQILSGREFRHRAYQSPKAKANDSARLHVYIEGDGRPWIAGGLLPSSDPTPANPLALRLMAKDDSPALYLGRPCYFGFADDGHCSEKYWTSARYSETVVNSMAVALNNYVEQHSIKEVLLIGYSGGGTLAVLMAPHIRSHTEVLTLAANLDIDAWTRLHNYLPLTQSLNPMTSARLEGIAHRHHAGTDDTNVMPEFVRRFSEQHAGLFISNAGFNHVCCWEQQWPRLLRNLQDSPAVH